MKSIFKIIALLSLSLMLMFGAVSAFATDVVSPPAGFEWLTAAVPTLMAALSAIPVVGKVLAIALQVISFLGGFLTLLSVFVQSVLAMPEVVARWAGAHALADKIKAISDKILPWLKYLSMFNVQKQG